ncbi:MAG: SRPBCC family protein [Tannerellaceae bacterium]|jgi:hypothetical protein|nr:SRPBCC family protein [Tannerellaceae bacterium]
MTKYKSAVRTIPYGDTKVYAMLSDLSNLNKVKDFLAGQGITNLVCDADSCSMTLSTAGTLEFSVVERTPCSSIKMKTSKAGLPVMMTIGLEPVAPNETTMQITASLDINPFMASMLAAPLKEILERAAEALASLSYE